MNSETINDPNQISSTPTQVIESPKKCKHLPIIIVLAILAVGGLGFGGFELWQNIQKDSDIKNLQAKIDNSAELDKKDDADIVIEHNTSIFQGLRFINDDLSFSDQRYRLMYNMGVENGQHDSATHEKKYYVMDMESLGNVGSIKEFDLVSILSPIEENEIANELPEASKNALGWITNKNQCESFYTTYHDPVYRGKIIETIGIDISKEMPIEVLYHCRQDDGTQEVAFSYTIYLVDVENKTAKKFQYQPENRADFSN